MVPGSLVVHADHQQQIKTLSQATSNADVIEVTSQVILPSTLVESRTSGLRNRDGSRVIVWYVGSQTGYLLMVEY